MDEKGSSVATTSFLRAGAVFNTFTASAIDTCGVNYTAQENEMTTAEKLEALRKTGYRGSIEVQIHDDTAAEYYVTANGWILRAIYTHYARPEGDAITTECERRHKSRRQRARDRAAHKPQV